MKKKIVAIIQSRLSSTRLPQKAIRLIMGKPMLWHVIERVKRAKLIDIIVLATTVNKEDGLLIKIAKDCGIESFAGSEKDVLDRYYQAAMKYNAEIIVRITGDCPLIDPNVIDRTVDCYLNHHFDYICTGAIKPTYPDGLDTEVFAFKTLERAWKEATLTSEREHVTPYIKKNSHLFKIKNLMNSEDISHMRWTVDEKCDFKFVREIYNKLYKEGEMFYMEDILSLLKKHPELMDINKGIKRDEGYLKSLETDKIIEVKGLGNGE